MPAAPVVHPLGVLKRHTPDWPLDLDAVARAARLRFRPPDNAVAELAHALRTAGLPAQAVRRESQLFAFRTDQKPLRNATRGTWPWPMEWMKQQTLYAVRMDDRIWTLDGARRWEDAMRGSHVLDQIDPFSSGYVFELFLTPETPVVHHKGDPHPDVLAWRAAMVTSIKDGRASARASRAVDWRFPEPEDRAVHGEGVGAIAAGFGQVTKGIPTFDADALVEAGRRWWVRGRATDPDAGLAWFSGGDAGTMAALRRARLEGQLAPAPERVGDDAGPPEASARAPRRPRL